MTGQLLIPFTYGDLPGETDLAKAEAIIQKYLRISAEVYKYYNYCMDRVPEDYCRKKRGLHPSMQRYYRTWDRLYNAAKTMIERLGLKCLHFKELENELWQNGYPDSKTYKECRKKLDGFGYIQQEFNNDDYSKEEDGSLTGYWYWLFEDPIAQIPVPEEIINKYISKYGNP